MYKKLKTTHPDSAELDALKINLRTYNKILKRNINMAKSAYYQASFSKYKNDIKRTWSVKKEVLNKTQNTPDYPDYFKLDGCAGVEIKPNFPLAWGMSSPEKLLVPKKNH